MFGRADHNFIAIKPVEIEIHIIQGIWTIAHQHNNGIIGKQSEPHTCDAYENYVIFDLYDIPIVLQRFCYTTI